MTTAAKLVPMSRRYPILVFSLLLLVMMSYAQTKSKVVGKWKETEILIDGKPEKPPETSNGEVFYKSQTELQIQQSDKTVTVKVEQFVSVPGQPRETVSSEVLVLNLDSPVSLSLIPGGEEYSTTAKLDDHSLLVTYADKKSGQVVRERLWSVSADGKHLEASSRTPGARECISKTEWNPSMTLEDLKKIANSSDCKPTSGAVRIFKRR